MKGYDNFRGRITYEFTGTGGGYGYKNRAHCITQALINAVEGRTEEGLIFCGTNAYRAHRIETVQEIMEEFTK